jgi:hypothetical protein
MRYMKVLWLHRSSHYPSVLYSEIGEDDCERRKVDMYADGRMSFASSTEHSGDTRLGETEIPPIEVIAVDPEFDPVAISAKEFEEIWLQARNS